MPLLGPQSFFLLIINVIYSFQVFDIVFVLTGGGPQDATSVLVTYAYQTGFVTRDQGYASAIGVVLLLLALGFTAVRWRMSRTRDLDRMTATESAAPRPATAVRTRRPRRRRGRGALLLRTLVALVVAVVTLFPLYWMVVVALTSRSDLLGGTLRLIPASITFDNFAKVLDRSRSWTWFGNSVVDRRGRRGADGRGQPARRVRVRAPAVPRLVDAVPRRARHADAAGADDHGRPLPARDRARPVRQLLGGRAADGGERVRPVPRAAVPARHPARADRGGAGSTAPSHLRVFRSVVLPLSRPLIAVLFFMTLLSSWNDFAWPLIALKENSLFTLPIGLLYLQSENGPDYGSTMAFALIDVAPMVVLFLLFQRYFVQGFARSGIR